MIRNFGLNEIVVPLERRRREAHLDHQQSNSSAWRRQNTREARSGDRRAQREVLAQLGFTAAEIDALRASGTVPDGKSRTA